MADFSKREGMAPHKIWGVPNLIPRREESAVSRPDPARTRVTSMTASRRTRWLMVALLGATMLSAPGGARWVRAQTVVPTAKELEAWEPIWLLEGTWKAEIRGSLGDGEGLRTYEKTMDGVYTVARHVSVRLPQPESPEGDHHRELAVYSYDRERGTIVLREFIVEGYVLQSACVTEPRRITCSTESVESGPGIRARLTIDISDPFRFLETYELAFPGEELEALFTNTWTRVPALPNL